MCFNKKSSSSSSQSTKTETTYRDERIGASEGSAVVSAKDASAISIYDYSISQGVEDANDLYTVGYGGVLNVEDASPEVLDQVFEYVGGVQSGAQQFAEKTQAQFAQNMTDDLKEIVSEVVKYGALVAFGFIAWKVMA